MSYDINQIVAKIITQEKALLRNGQLVGADRVADIIAELSVLLAMTVPPHTKARKAFKHARADKFDKLLKDGKSVNQAETLLRMDKELIDQDATIDRIENWIKRTDVIISTMQTYIRVKTQEAKGNM